MGILDGDNLTDMSSAATLANAGHNARHTEANTAIENIRDAMTAIIVHGATAGTSRHAGVTRVLWEGSVAPTNATSGDYWWDTTNELIKRYDGSAWNASGNATYRTVADSLSADDSVGLFVPKLGDRLWISSAEFEVMLAPAAKSNRQRWPTITYPDSGVGIAAAVAFVPDHWDEYNLHLYWTNAGAGSGDVTWLYGVQDTAGDGDTLTTGFGSTVTVAAPAQDVVKVTTLNSGGTVPASAATEPWRITIRRNTGGLANAADMLGVLLERVTTAADPDPALLA